MSDISIFEAIWHAGTHRNHHAAGASATIPLGTGIGSTGWTGEADETATFPMFGRSDFLWWSAGGASGLARGADPRAANATFPAGDEPGSVSYWYVPEGVPGQPPGPPGLTFDAWSLLDGQFLDWDTDPFEVTPPGDRRDDVADSTHDAVTVSVPNASWPGRDDLAFSHWAVVTGQATVDALTVSVGVGQSAIAFAVYGAASARTHPKWPWYLLIPQTWTMGDPARERQILDALASRPESDHVAALVANSTLRALSEVLAPSLTTYLDSAFAEAHEATLKEALALAQPKVKDATEAPAELPAGRKKGDHGSS